MASEIPGCVMSTMPSRRTALRTRPVELTVLSVLRTLTRRTGGAAIIGAAIVLRLGAGPSASLPAVVAGACSCFRLFLFSL